MTFLEWQQTYLNIYLKPRIKYHTYLIYNDIFNMHINEYFKNFNIEEVKKSDVNLYVCELLNKTTKNNKKLAPGTINLIITILKGLFKAAYENEIIIKNPTLTIKKVPEKPKEIQVLSKHNQKRIEEFCLEHIDDSRYLGILLTLYTGLRIGELLALKWSSVNLKTKILAVEQTKLRIKNNGKYENIFTEPKTHTSNRIIPITNFLVPYLIEEKNKGNIFLVSYNHDGVNIRSYQMFFHSILKKLNIPLVNYHALRHTFATRCVELGIDIKTISELLGHRNATITLNRYSHSLFETKRKAIKKLANINKYD